MTIREINVSFFTGKLKSDQTGIDLLRARGQSLCSVPLDHRSHAVRGRSVIFKVMLTSSLFRVKVGPTMVAAVRLNRTVPRKGRSPPPPLEHALSAAERTMAIVESPAAVILRNQWAALRIYGGDQSAETRRGARKR